MLQNASLIAARTNNMWKCVSSSLTGTELSAKSKFVQLSLFLFTLSQSVEWPSSSS